jgi:hypothetical protein
MEVIEVVSGADAAVAADVEISRVRAIREAHALAADVFASAVIGGDIDRA